MMGEEHNSSASFAPANLRSVAGGGVNPSCAHCAGPPQPHSHA
jgi:hypothetical protein